MAHDLRVLNSGPEGDSTATEDLGLGTVHLSKSLQKLMLQMRGEFMGADGRGIDYGRLSSSALFAQYVALAGRLRNCAVADLGERQRMAFFISIRSASIYNGLFHYTPTDGNKWCPGGRGGGGLEGILVQGAFTSLSRGGGGGGGKFAIIVICRGVRLNNG